MTDGATMPDERLDAMAAELVAALGTGQRVAPFARRGRDGGLALDEAYAVADRVHARRLAWGERARGRKIGFTNRALWPLFGADGPMWGHMYEGTVHDVSALGGFFDLSGLAEPRIEPEIAFGLARAPEVGMDEPALMECVAWVAHGFELVQSVYPGWAFGMADAVAAFGLHGALALGERHEVGGDREGWRAALSSFALEVWCDGVLVARSHARDVLGGPLSALRFLVEEIERRPGSAPLAAGEVVTTGTLTGAHPVAPGQRWTTRVEGARFGDLDLRLR